ncbi:MAG: CoA-transferase [Dehalococcoidia bacterium]|nr:CoA-transferase [Dehalococcoidia bacterium]
MSPGAADLAAGLLRLRLLIHRAERGRVPKRGSIRSPRGRVDPRAGEPGRLPLAHSRDAGGGLAGQRDPAGGDPAGGGHHFLRLCITHGMAGTSERGRSLQELTVDRGRAADRPVRDRQAGSRSGCRRLGDGGEADLAAGLRLRRGRSAPLTGNPTRADHSRAHRRRGPQPVSRRRNGLARCTRSGVGHGRRAECAMLTGAQVDRFGNVNTLVIGDYAEPGTAPGRHRRNMDLACTAGRSIIIMSLEDRRFVPRCDFITSPSYIDGPGAREREGLKPQGPNVVVSTMGVFGFDTPDGGRTGSCEMVLQAVFPGIDADTVAAMVPWDLRVAADLAETAPPTAEELEWVRRLDPPPRCLPARGGISWDVNRRRAPGYRKAGVASLYRNP